MDKVTLSRVFSCVSLYIVHKWRIIVIFGQIIMTAVKTRLRLKLRLKPLETSNKWINFTNM